MIREWADEDTREQIDEALTAPVAADSYDEDEAWSMFESAMRAEQSRGR